MFVLFVSFLNLEFVETPFSSEYSDLYLIMYFNCVLFSLNKLTAPNCESIYLHRPLHPGKVKVGIPVKVGMWYPLPSWKPSYGPHSPLEWVDLLLVDLPWRGAFWGPSFLVDFSSWALQHGWPQGFSLSLTQQFSKTDTQFAQFSKSRRAAAWAWVLCKPLRVATMGEAWAWQSLTILSLLRRFSYFYPAFLIVSSGWPIWIISQS